MRYLLERTAVGPNVVALLGQDYTGGLVVMVNELQHTYPRDFAGLLRDRLTEHLDATASCPRCDHGRVEHFTLWTQAGHLYGCSHGTAGGHPLAGGLPCDCPGMPS